MRKILYIDVGNMSYEDAERKICEIKGTEYKKIHGTLVE